MAKRLLLWASLVGFVVSMLIVLTTPVGAASTYQIKDGKFVVHLDFQRPRLVLVQTWTVCGPKPKLCNNNTLYRQVGPAMVGPGVVDLDVDLPQDQCYQADVWIDGKPTHGEVGGGPCSQTTTTTQVTTTTVVSTVPDTTTSSTAFVPLNQTSSGTPLTYPASDASELPNTGAEIGVIFFSAVLMIASGAYLRKRYV